MSALRVATAALVVVADLFMWATARRYRYGKTADGAFIAFIVGLTGVVFVPDDEVATWSLLLALAATIVLFVMSLNKGELK